MINNSLTMTRNNEIPSIVYNKPLNRSQTQDYSLYRHRRLRFLQQSALYLGADLSNSKTQSLCFSGTTICTQEE